MKHSRPLDCCCCRWLTLLLVASSIIYVSPESSTTATVKFNQQQQHTTSSAATSMTHKNNNNDNNKYNKNQSISNNKDNNVTTRIELTTIMMELTTEIATVAVAAAAQIATKTTKLSMDSATVLTTTTTTTRRGHPHTNTTTTIAVDNFTNKDIHNSNKLSKNKHKSNLQQELLLQYQQQKRQQQQQLVHDSMFFSKGHFKEIQKKLYYEKKQQQRYTRQADDKDEGIDKCRQFTVGDMEKKILYSPDFPYNYTNKINCTRVLEAPEGQIVRLDFRDKFHIEGTEGECKFDFLEVRDGKYGFSKEIGTYCGTTFPPIITSKERYLWLHFQSDESIEYSGFTAVYEFLTRKQDTPSTDLNCTIYKGGHSGIANSTIDIGDDIREIVARNKIPLDCIFRIEVQENWKISISFKHFKLAKPNDCQANFLDIFPEETTMPLRIKNLCGSAGESVTSTSNVLNLHFYAEQDAINTTTFTVLYTAIRDKSTKCNDDEYDCADDTCIHESLKCDGDKNCKFSWDEEKCPTLEDDQPEHITIIMYVFGSILGGMILTYLVNCVRKIMRDQKIIREHVRQSKESKLDQLDRQSKARSQTNLSMPMSPRQKHSQTSLQILDDVSNRYYREVVPISVQTGGNGGGGKIDLKEKEHSILRHHHHHDMTVQTSLVLDDSSSTTTAATNEAPGGAGGAGNVCDMGCQTRESLFAPTLMRQKSISSMGVSGTLPPPPRFSTFGYDTQQPPPPPPPAVSTIARHNIRVPTESIELEERPNQQQHAGATTTHQHQHHQHQHQGSAGSGTMRPQEMCHHHHQHQQHLQQQQQQQLQQQRQQKYQQQQQPYAPTTASGQQTLQRATQKQQQQQQQQQQPKQHQSTATIIPSTFLPISTPTSAAAGAPAIGWIGSKNNSKHQKVDGSNAYSDIRNSAPDVIIMTSH